MATVAILGAGGHGRDIAAIVRACGMVAEFYDDAPTFDCQPIDGMPERDFIVGINDPKVRKAVRERAVGAPAPPLIHPTAVVDPSTVFGNGVVIGANTTVGPECSINDHTHIGASCTVTRSILGAYVTVGPGVDIAGDCYLKQGAFLGVGCVVKNLVTIGAWARIGAGSVVIEDVPDGVTVKGVPAR